MCISLMSVSFNIQVKDRAKRKESERKVKERQKQALYQSQNETITDVWVLYQQIILLGK